MRKQTINLYDFNELNEAIQQRIIDNLKYEGNFGDFIFQDAGETLNKFCSLFNIDYKTIDFLNSYYNNYMILAKQEVMELSGLRLRTYLINNFYDYLYTRKIIKYGETFTSPQYNNFARMRVLKTINRKNEPPKYYYKYYSNLKRVSDCPLTGVCHDHDILEPVYHFIKTPDNNTNFEQLIEQCINNLCNAIEKEYESIFEKEYVTEHFAINNIQFLQDGTIFNN